MRSTIVLQCNKENYESEEAERGADGVEFVPETQETFCFGRGGVQIVALQFFVGWEDDDEGEGNDGKQKQAAD